MVKGMKPIYDKNSKIIILGSLPSVKSIENQEYYNNPTNQFWQILSYVFENKILEFSKYEDKIMFLKKNKIALWDVLSSADRIGSLDKNIKNENYNDLYSFITKNNINKVFVNGTKAGKLLKKYLKLNGINIEYTFLTSSSSANTKYTLNEKTDIWKKNILNN